MNIDSDRVCFSPHILFLPQICSKFWRTYKRFSSSGQNDPARWSSFSDSDTLLDHSFALFHDHNLVMELVSPEIGAADAEGDDPLEAAPGRRAMTTSKQRKMDRFGFAARNRELHKHGHFRR